LSRKNLPFGRRSIILPDGDGLARTPLQTQVTEGTFILPFLLDDQPVFVPGKDIHRTYLYTGRAVCQAIILVYQYGDKEAHLSPFFQGMGF